MVILLLLVLQVFSLNSIYVYDTKQCNRFDIFRIFYVYLNATKTLHKQTLQKHKNTTSY